MKKTGVPLLVVALIVLLGAATVMGACSKASEPPPAVVPGAPPLVDAPGLYDMAGDRMRAVGVLDRVELEGGFWALVGVAGTDSVESTVIAVIENPDSLDVELADLRGRYVEVTGTLLDGASIRMAGPEIRVERIEVLGKSDGE